MTAPDEDSVARPDLTYEMRGPRGVRHTISDFLRSELPRTIRAAREAWDVVDEELPIPVSDLNDPKRDAFFDREPAAIDRHPMVAVTSGRRSQRATDFEEDGSPVFIATYPIRVFSWVMDEGWDRTQDMRDDMATCIAITLLAHVDLGSVGRWLQMVPSTLVTDFSAVAKGKGDRYVAGSFVGFDVRATETLTDRLALPGGQPRDTVARVSATGTLLPSHPALL